MTLLYDWLKKAAKAQGNNKAVVYRDNYLSWRGLLHRVDRRAQEFKSMGIKEGAWVGLMLGNVPDFVILALALSKLDAAIVPIDPTTGGRELELILAAAPLRALVTRPRGSEGSHLARTARARRFRRAPCPARASQRPTAPPPREPLPTPVPAADAAEVRRRLQGTLLTCCVYKRKPPDHGVDPIAVLFTADSLGDPKGVLRTDKNTVAAVDHAIASLGMNDKTKVLVAVPLFHAYGWDLGFLPTLKLGSHDVPRGGDLRAPHRQADPRARRRRPARHAVDVRRAVEAADREEARASRSRATSPPARASIRRSPTSSSTSTASASCQLLPLDRSGDGRARGQRQVPDHRRQADRRRRGEDHRARRQAVDRRARKA